MRKLVALSLAWSIQIHHCQAADSGDLRLVPFPKEVRLHPSLFRLDQPLWLEVGESQREVMTRLLNEELRRGGLNPVQVRSSSSAVLTFSIHTGQASPAIPPLPETESPERYALEVGETGVVCAASEPAGLFYGLQTLCQLIRANRRGDALPTLSVQDWPSLRWRCFQDDMTRGPSSTLETLKFEAALASGLKLNLMTYYMEYQFAFRKHPDIGPPNGSLTPDDLSSLVAFAKPLHVDILGNQQSFGHFGWILKRPEYASLRETGDVLTPVREETYQFLDDLYSEVCPRLPFPWFNVCCDETYGLGTGPSRDLASKIGLGGVYVRHIRRVHDLLRDKYQKRMMMWGDIILQHPAHLENVPKDTLMLTWGYDARPSFEDQIIPFAKSGYEFFVCPGVNNWNRILPDFGVAVTNIQHFVRDGVRHGAIGMLNTDWEDDGEALNAVKWHGDAWAAECAWNASTTRLEDFQRRIGGVLFGEQGDHFGQAVTLLARTHRLPGMKGMFNSRFWENDFAPSTRPTAIQQTSSNLLALVQPALEHLKACRDQARGNLHALDTFIFGARRMELLGQRMLAGVEAAQLYQKASESLPKPTPKEATEANSQRLARIEQLIRQNRDDHAALGRQFATLWLSESKPYALDWTLKRYTNAVKHYDSLLMKVTHARSALVAGRPLPAPEEIGLPMPQPLSRLIRPRKIESAPLAPTALWLDASASHRQGMRVRAGAADRVQLPVEVEVELPPALHLQPVRAFLIDTQRPPQELLVQLDALQQSGKSRLVLVIPGTLARETEVSVHLYLGLSRKPEHLADGVSTSTGPNGMAWVENDRLRLLLGHEGAHIYRWEVKSAGNRDLTMPGEAGWAGFSDLATRRHSRYRLDATAQGPAMVEYQCEDEAGNIKTLRIYGGANWIEVFLSEPTSVYWDFDHPKNFAADGPTPGHWLFSDGQTGPVGREADGVSAQVKRHNTFWGIKYNSERLALGIATPETPAFHHIAPGAGAGGVGIENSPPVQHLVTLAGVLDCSPAETMDRLRTTLDLKRPVEVTVHPLQQRDLRAR